MVTCGNSPADEIKESLCAGNGAFAFLEDKSPGYIIWEDGGSFWDVADVHRLCQENATYSAYVHAESAELRDEAHMLFWRIVDTATHLGTPRVDIVISSGKLMVTRYIATSKGERIEETTTTYDAESAVFEDVLDASVTDPSEQVQRVADGIAALERYSNVFADIEKCLELDNYSITVM